MSKTTQSKAGTADTKKRAKRAKKKEAPPVDATSLAASPPVDQVAAKNGHDVLHETSGIISMVKGLEEQVEMAFMLKEVLEQDLETTQERLEEELATRAQLEVENETLQVRVGQVSQLREDVSFVELERTRLAEKLAQLEPLLKQTTESRDTLTEQLAAADARIKGLESDKVNLEGRVMNLKDKLVNTDRLHEELEDLGKSYQTAREHVREQENRLEAVQEAKEAMQRELTGAHSNARGLRSENEEKREKLSSAHGRTTDLQIALDDERATNRTLVESNTRLESDLKRMTVDHDAASKELEAFKQAMRDIRTEADQTSGRVRRRYKKKGDTEASGS